MKYVKQKTGHAPYEMTSVFEQHEGKTISGGRLVAYFSFEKDATEYIDFKTRKLKIK